MTVVYVVGGDHGIEKMFRGKGFIVTNEFSTALEPDLVVFTGGEDLNPKMYGDIPAGAVGWNDQRDAFEKEKYERFVYHSAIVGICRGAQFLTVMNGGKLIQHISGHTGRNKVKSFIDYYLVEGHHQGMLPRYENAEIIAKDPRDENVEIAFFPMTNCLAFQAHPEWDIGGETEKFFFELIEDLLHIKVPNGIPDKEQSDRGTA